MLIILSFILSGLLLIVFACTIQKCKHRGVIVDTTINLYKDDDAGNGTHFALFEL